MNTLFKTGLYFFLVLTVNCTVFSTVYAAEQTAAIAEQSPASEPAEITPDEAEEPEEQQYYIVEVILFQHLNEQGKLSEVWSSPQSLGFNTEIDNNLSAGLSADTIAQEMPEAISEAVPINAQENILTDDIPALAEYDLHNQEFIPLRNGIAEVSAENYKLADSAAHLRYSPNFKLLAHFGWIQRSIDKNQALPIRITANQFSDQLLPSGEIKLYVSRYLHMQVDLQASECLYNEESDSETDKQLDKQLENADAYTPTANEQAADGQFHNSLVPLTTMNELCDNRVYVFKQNRKMRSRELHYIDNPVFGLLVYVTPLSMAKDALPEMTEKADAAM